jgi:hypothetical protein
VGSEFAPAGFEHWVRGWVERGRVVGFYQPVLVNIALAHPMFCARLVAWGELAIANQLDSWIVCAACSDWRRDFDDQQHPFDVVCARAWRAGLAIFRRESGSHPAAVLVCDFLCGAGGRCVGIGRAFAADEGTSGIRPEQGFGQDFRVQTQPFRNALQFRLKSLFHGIPLTFFSAATSCSCIPS